MTPIQVCLGQRGPDDYIREIAAAGGNFGYHTRYLLGQCVEDTAVRGMLNLVLVRGAELYDGTAYVWQVYQRAEQRDLEFCPAEAAPALFLERPDLPEGSFGKMRFASSETSLYNLGGYPMQFEIFRGLGGSRILAEVDCNTRHVQVSPETLWVFAPKREHVCVGGEARSQSLNSFA